ncbi:MAG: hypothetical protein AAF515_17120 [Pseudomonadota bacterium]
MVFLAPPGSATIAPVAVETRLTRSVTTVLEALLAAAALLASRIG